MYNFKQLRQFKPEELLFNEEETRIVLKFIFRPVDHELIDSLPMSDSLREFAQALLVEAIDASYAVGFIEVLFESTANPTKGAIQILKSFAKKAAKRWFKHATANDLRNVKVYQFVLNELARSFRNSDLRAFTVGVLHQPRGALMAYKKPIYGIDKVWS